MIVSKVTYAPVVAMARELARASGQPYEKVLRLETASIIKICALAAQIASAAAIKRDVLNRQDTNFETPGGALITINKHKGTGRTWFVMAGQIPARGPGGTFCLVFDAGPSQGHHLPTAFWVAFLAGVEGKRKAVEIMIAERLKRRGLMRLSWIQMGDALGVPLSTVSPQGNLQELIARGARGPGGRAYTNGTADVLLTSRTLIIRLRNQSPLAIKNHGQSKLDSAAGRRVYGFKIAMEKEVFKDMKLRSARWRGIFVSER